MQKGKADTGPLLTRWGYWFGGFLCVLGLFALSLGLIPLISSILSKPIVLELPGQRVIRLRLPGTYIGIMPAQGLAPGEKSKAMGLQYYLSDEKEEEFFDVQGFPSRNYFTDKEEQQVPLFQFIVEQKGEYILSSDYSIGIEGPKFSALLFHADVGYVRTELIVGVIVSLLLGVLGIVLIRKSNRLDKLPAR